MDLLYSFGGTIIIILVLLFFYRRSSSVGARRALSIAAWFFVSMVLLSGLTSFVLGSYLTSFITLPLFIIGAIVIWRRQNDDFRSSSNRGFTSVESLHDNDEWKSS